MILACRVERERREERSGVKGSCTSNTKLGLGARTLFKVLYVAAH